MRAGAKRERGLVTYVYDFEHPAAIDLAERKAVLGGKAANLAVMATDLCLPVPPGFTVTTGACRAYLAEGWPDGLDDEIRAHVARVERIVGRRFGGPGEPLLVSVRSGAPVSMPGMMDTILNLGLTETTTRGIAEATGDEAFPADCRRRFRQMYRDIVGADAPEDPWAQLRAAVEAVFRSWNSDRARTYRRHEGIPDDLGTAVTVQAMVFGNRGADSATGVLFTRNPATGENRLYGDVMFDAQGEDVVAGTHRTESLAVLDERLPQVAAELRAASSRLERHFADLCDIEFTIERGRLWLLQVRVGKRSPHAALRIAVEMAEDPTFPLTRPEAVRRVEKILTHPPTSSVCTGDAPPSLTVGLPASPGVASGEIVVSPDAAESRADSGRPVILVRRETSPDDVHGMARAAGLLTARGGLASHAAVVARGWGIPAVVGATAVDLHDDGVGIGPRWFAVGETITIDGSTGEVFAGVVERHAAMVPEAATLLEWAAELSIAIVTDESGVAPAAAGPISSAPGEDEAPQPVLGDDVARTLLVKGLAPAEAVAAALCSPVEIVTTLLEGLVTEGCGERTSGAYRLTGAGKLRALDVIAADRDRLGTAAADEALDRFRDLDQRMKAAVTAWQVRTVEGEQTFNDHADHEYDEAVLAQLGAIHDDVVAWVGPVAAGLPRLHGYQTRLSRALELARDGDQRYVASPRVESYHSVWFELHEELIRLAGRRRVDETETGAG